jgi:hypothetical protein
LLRFAVISNLATSILLPSRVKKCGKSIGQILLRSAACGLMRFATSIALKVWPNFTAGKFCCGLLRRPRRQRRQCQKCDPESSAQLTTHDAKATTRSFKWWDTWLAQLPIMGQMESKGA